MDQRQVEIAGQRIACTDSGRPGQRPAIFVHGNSHSSRTWLPIVTSDFGQRFRCLTFDLPGPGPGQSGPGKGPANYSTPGYAGQGHRLGWRRPWPPGPSGGPWSTAAPAPRAGHPR
ncbi:MAG TPA: hypothetical protein VH478_03140 [Trebonia sp.]|nr:hypothetical protein [Trebonia sp.]